MAEPADGERVQQAPELGDGARLLAEEPSPAVEACAHASARRTQVEIWRLQRRGRRFERDVRWRAPGG